MLSTPRNKTTEIMKTGIHTKLFSQMIGGWTNCSYKGEDGEWVSGPCPTVGTQISMYLEENPQYELIDQIDVTEPRVINDHSVKAFFQLKTDYNIREAAPDMLEALKFASENIGKPSNWDDEILEKVNSAIEKALK